MVGLMGSVDIMYSFVIILASIMIYAATKELYELTEHKGIKYFRRAFLFFALAYFFRSWVKFSALFGAVDPFTMRALSWISLLLFMATSTVAALYLISSLFAKHLKTRQNEMLLHLTAGLFAFIILFVVNPLVHLAIHALLLLIMVGALTYAHKQKKKNNGLYTIYVLMGIFWMLNLFDILIPSYLRPFQILVYLSSIALFMGMLYRVLRTTGAN